MGIVPDTAFIFLDRNLKFEFVPNFVPISSFLSPMLSSRFLFPIPSSNTWATLCSSISPCLYLLFHIHTYFSLLVPSCFRVLPNLYPPVPAFPTSSGFTLSWFPVLKCSTPFDFLCQNSLISLAPLPYSTSLPVPAFWHTFNLLSQNSPVHLTSYILYHLVPEWSHGSDFLFQYSPIPLAFCSSILAFHLLFHDSLFLTTYSIILPQTSDF